MDAIDYLIKPVEAERFQKAVEKAQSYHSLLLQEEKEDFYSILASEYFFVKAERRYFKVNFSDILFVEGLKDYVILQLGEQRIITRMSLKAVFDLLPKDSFLRVNKSYIVNTALSIRSTTMIYLSSRTRLLSGIAIGMTSLKAS